MKIRDESSNLKIMLRSINMIDNKQKRSLEKKKKKKKVIKRIREKKKLK